MVKKKTKKVRRTRVNKRKKTFRILKTIILFLFLALIIGIGLMVLKQNGII